MPTLVSLVILEELNPTGRGVRLISLVIFEELKHTGHRGWVIF